MGLLDEAIRQHLELKRQHGASDEELKLQEQEALGPVRREPLEPVESPEDVEPEDDLAPVGDEPAYDDPMEAEAEAPIYDEARLELADEVPVDAPREDFADPGFRYEAGEGEAEGDTEALAPDLEPHPVPTGDTPTQGFEAVPEPPAGELSLEEDDPDPGDDDVLEETPEFLQETPEHDRLWFEQRPPRDFDFDE